MSIQIQMPTDAETRRMFDAVPVLERYRVGDKAVTAGAKPVVKRARQLAPRGNAADRRKRSQKQQSEADWNYPLWKTIKRVTRKYQRARAVAIVGPEHPKGNKVHFDSSPKGRRVFYWGRNAGKTKVMIRNFLVQAFDETRTQQRQAILASLRKSMKDIWE